MWKNIRKQYKNNKLKIIALIWNYEFELPYGSYYLSGIQDCIEYIVKKHETLTEIPLIRVTINRNKNRLVFKIKDGNKLYLQTPKAMKLIGSTEKINRENKTWRKITKS